MKRFLSATLLMLALASTSALADGLKLYLYPNTGAGDNFGVVSWTGATSQLIFGGIPADFFDDESTPYSPGSSLGGTTQIFFEPSFMRIGKTTYELQIDPGTLFMSPFTLPTNGKDFTAFVQISFSATGIFIDTGAPISISGSANGRIHFTLVTGDNLPNNAAYFPDQAGFIQTPEPGTWGLVGLGLAGILARRRWLASGLS